MSDIRFEGWLHRTGTGGVYQDSAGNVGIASTQPQQKLDIGNGGFQVGPTGIATVTTVNTTNIINSTSLSHRNLIINGAMQVAQRGTVTGITNQVYGGPDRFETHINALGTWTTSQTSSASDQTTTGFLNSLKMQCTSADASPSSGDYAILLQHVEGYNAAQLQWGTANAKQVTLSFWCKANINGWSSGTKSFVAEIQAGSTTLESGTLVTLNTNDTWQKISVTFPAQTAQALNTGNASGMSVNLWLDAGSGFTSGTLSSAWSNKAGADRAPGLNLGLGNNTANYFQITGVQLEVGTVDTPFEHRSVGEELRRCQRYFYALNNSGSVYYWFHPIDTSNTYRRCSIRFPTTMRATPTASDLTGNNDGSAGTPTGTQHADQDHIDIHWNSSGLVELTHGHFSAEL